MKTSSSKMFGTADEIARDFGFSKGTLANMRSRGVGPKFYKPKGRKVLYRYADVEAWIQGFPVLTKDSIPGSP